MKIAVDPAVRLKVVVVLEVIGMLYMKERDHRHDAVWVVAGGGGGALGDTSWAARDAPHGTGWAAAPARTSPAWRRKGRWETEFPLWAGGDWRDSLAGEIQRVSAWLADIGDGGGGTEWAVGPPVSRRFVVC